MEMLSLTSAKLSSRLSNRLPAKKWLLTFAFFFAVMVIGLVTLAYINRASGGLWLRDFQVLYRAGGRIAAGEDLIRPAQDGFYSYKYSPTAALLFTPFAALPYGVAQVAYWLFLSLVVLVGFYLALKLVYPDFPQSGPQRLGLLLGLAGLTLGVHIWSELTLGQVNHLLLVSYLAVAWLYTQKRPGLLGFIWALGIFIKPFGLILLPYFVIKKRYREIGYFAAFSLGLFALPAVFYGGGFLAQQRAWYHEITVELANKGDLIQPGNHTLVSIIAQFSPLRYLPADSQYLTVYRFVMYAAVALLVLLVIRRGRGLRQAEALEFAFILALAPLLSYTNDNAFGLVELAVVLLLLNFEKLRAWEKATAAAGCLLIGGNFYNQLPVDWGQGAYEYYDSLSLLGFGTMMLLVCLFSWRRREARQAQSQT